MKFISKDDYINKNFDIQNLKELQEKYPYFSLPYILEHLQNGQNNPSEILRFKTNSVLLHNLKMEYEKPHVVESTHQELIIDQTYTEEETLILEDNELNKIINDELIAQNDFYSLQGIKISDSLPDISSLHGSKKMEQKPLNQLEDNESEDFDVKALLVQMSFEEWLSLITQNKQKEIEDIKEQEELKNNWKKKKLAEAIEEELDDIPEEVFKMAVDSIEKEEVLSESIAEVYALQGKAEQAIDIYKKLILQFPEKKVYFATKISTIRNNYNL